MNKLIFPLLLLLAVFPVSCGDDAPTDMNQDVYSCPNSSCDAPPPFLENLVGTWNVYENTANPDQTYNFSSPSGTVMFLADGTGVGSTDGFFEGLGSINFNYGFDAAFDALQIEFVDDGGPVFTKYIKQLDNDCGEIIIEQTVNLASDERVILAMCRA